MDGYEEDVPLLILELTNYEKRMPLILGTVVIDWVMEAMTEKYTAVVCNTWQRVK